MGVYELNAQKVKVTRWWNELCWIDKLEVYRKEHYNKKDDIVEIYKPPMTPIMTLPIMTSISYTTT